MVGTIRKRDILAHPIVTIRCFGWTVFFRALLAGKDATFLSLLADTKALEPAPAKVPELVQRCINLELDAERIYRRLADRFADRPPVADFFASLAQQEEGHAQLLELCRVTANRTIWREECFAPHRDSIPLLERQMKSVESSVEAIEHAADALRLVIEIEGTEVNRLFGSVVAASGSDFVKCLLVFQTAAEKHIDCICDEIPELEPDLAEECRELRDRFFVGAE